MVKNITIVVGARPNFMKAAALVHAADKTDLHISLIHTGQHYDPYLSDAFLEGLALPKPDHHLLVGSGSHGKVTARCLERIEEVLQLHRPDLVIVVGDVNSTLAAALAAAKLQIPVGHVEAGLRSGDRGMPEEINRIVTDSISSLLFVSEPSGITNLIREGHTKRSMHLVGNTMIDTLYKFLPVATAQLKAYKLGLPTNGYALVTLHRPANVDTKADLTRIVEALKCITLRMPVVFPMHPRTSASFGKHGFTSTLANISDLKLSDPLDYVDFISLMSTAKVVVTDSGGVQEETTALSIPCITMRENTERPITLMEGTNRLVGNSVAKLAEALDSITNATKKSPALWDGHAAERIISVIEAINEL